MHLRLLANIQHHTLSRQEVLGTVGWIDGKNNSTTVAAGMKGRIDNAVSWVDGYDDEASGRYGGTDYISEGISEMVGFTDGVSDGPSDASAQSASAQLFVYRTLTSPSPSNKKFIVV